MTVKDLIFELQQLNPKQKIAVASDEEWNNVFFEVNLAEDTETHAMVIFGLSGSEDKTRY